MYKKTLSEVFLNYLGTDYSVNNILYALEQSNNLLKKKTGEFENEEELNKYFFEEDDVCRIRANGNFQEILDFGDVFGEFDEYTLGARLKRWGEEIFIVKVLQEALVLRQIIQIKEGYLRCSKKEIFDKLLDTIFENRGKKEMEVVGISNGRIIIKNTFFLYNKFLFTSKKQVKQDYNMQTIKGVNMLFELFSTFGTIILMTEEENYCFFLYKYNYVKLPNILAKKMIQCAMENPYDIKYKGMSI